MARILSLIVASLLLTGCALDDAAERYADLEARWEATHTPGTALSGHIAEAWADSFWAFRARFENTPEASKATVRSIELSRLARDLTTIDARLQAVSIHDEAMIDLAPLLGSSVTSDDGPRTWRHIANNSTHEAVQTAALLQLANHYYLQKRFVHVANLLDTLAVLYDVDPDHARYGNRISQMRESVRRLTVGEVLPSFRTVDIAGSVVTSDQLRGRVVMLYFYGSGCGSCIPMYPTINELHARHDDLYLLGVSADRGFLTLEEFRDFLTEYDIEWPQTLDHDLFAQYEVGVLSTVLIIDRDGRLAWIGRATDAIDAEEHLRGLDLPEALARLMPS